MLVDMGMRIDQPRRDDQPFGVDDFGGAGVELRRDRGDAALADADVADGVDAVLRIDDPPAFDDDIEGGCQRRDRRR